MEAALLSHTPEAGPGVREAAAVPVETSEGGQALHAFVVPASVETQDLYGTLRARLPEYMIPSRIVGLDTLPRTVRGKVDRHRLSTSPRVASPLPDSVQDFGSLTGSERRVAKIWEELLGPSTSSPEASFFEVRGTSLSAFTLVHRVREGMALDREVLDVETVYRAPIVRELATHIDRVRSGGTLVALRRGSDSTLPLVFFVAPAGGTLGSYGKLTRALATSRELIGIRDPFSWGGRDPTMGFDEWVETFPSSSGEKAPGLMERAVRNPFHLLSLSALMELYTGLPPALEP